MRCSHNSEIFAGHLGSAVAPTRRPVFLVLALLIGALVGAVVVAFYRCHQQSRRAHVSAGGSPWRRLLVPVAGSLDAGYFLSAISRSPAAAVSPNQGGALRP